MFGMPAAWWQGLTTGFLIGVIAAFSSVLVFLGFSSTFMVLLAILAAVAMLIIDYGGLHKRGNR